MPKIKWSFDDFLGVMVVVIASILSIIAISDFFSLKDLITGISFESLRIVFVFLGQTLILVLPLFYLVVRKYKVSDEDLGFRRFNFIKGALAIIGGYFTFILIAFSVSAIEQAFDLNIPGFERQESHVPLFGNDQYSLFAAIFTVVILAPFVEEIFYRGFILQSLLARYSVSKGIFGGALIFALSHLEFRSVIPLFILGIIINRIFVKTKSLWPCIIFHAMNNSITLAVEYYLYSHPEILEKLG